MSKISLAGVRFPQAFQVTKARPAHRKADYGSVADTRHVGAGFLLLI